MNSVAALHDISDRNEAKSDHAKVVDAHAQPVKKLHYLIAFLTPDTNAITANCSLLVLIKKK